MTSRYRAHRLDKLCNSPMTGGRSLLLDLAAELRNAVYLEYVQIDREVLVHPGSSKPVACRGLARVNRQIRQELGTFPCEHATLLRVDVVDYNFGQLLELCRDLQEVAHALVVTAAPAPLALATHERATSLRLRRSDAPPSEPAYKLPAVTELVVLLSQKEEVRVNLLKPRIYAWCELFASDGRRIPDDAIRFVATAASGTPSIERAMDVISNVMDIERKYASFTKRPVTELRKILDALDLMAGPEDSDWMPPGATSAP